MRVCPQKCGVLWKTVCVLFNKILLKNIYADICLIQTATEQGHTPQVRILTNILDWKNKKQVQQFHAGVVDNGRLMDKLADSIDLTPSERVEKWNEERMEVARSTEEHRENTMWYAEWSRFSFQARSENEAAYKSLHEILSHNPPPKPREWQIVIIEHEKDLIRRNKLFWFAVQTSRCTPFEKRAVCHKLTLCQGSTHPETVQQLQVTLMGDIFVSTLTPDRPKRRRVRLMKWLRRVMKRLSSRAAVVQCEKNT